MRGEGLQDSVFVLRVFLQLCVSMNSASKMAVPVEMARTVFSRIDLLSSDQFQFSQTFIYSKKGNNCNKLNNNLKLINIVLANYNNVHFLSIFMHIFHAQLAQSLESRHCCKGPFLLQNWSIGDANFGPRG